MSHERKQFLASVLEKTELYLADGDKKGAETLIRTIPPELLESASHYSHVHALQADKKHNIRGFFRALQISDRLIMLRGGADFPDRPVFYIWKADIEEIEKVWNQMVELKAKLASGDEGFNRELKKLNLYQADACLKVSAAYSLILIVKNRLQSTSKTKKDLLLQAALSRLLINRKIELEAK